jgi:glycosyl transferase, group 1/2 family protein
VILYGATNAINDRRKGFSLLLQALQSLSGAYKNEYYLVIFGAERQRLDLDIPFRFMGYVRDHQILQALYSAADVMVVPSLEEAFGQTVTEAMACATPVVSFLETGPESIIEHKRTGYLARYADEKDLAAGIEWVLSSTKLNDELSVNARARIEESYDIRIIAKQYEKLYHQLLNS